MFKVMRCYLIFLLLASNCVSLAQSPAQSFDLRIKKPREFGYTLGDTISRTLVLELSNGYALVPDSLPSPGRLDLWLELDPPKMEQSENGDRKHYRIMLTYRLINLTESEQILEIPEHALKMHKGSMNWSIPVSPLRIAAHRVAPDPGESGLPALRPLAAPPLLDLQAEWLQLIAAGLLGVTSLVVLAWIYGVLPGLKRTHGPFARACRELRHAPASEETALLSLHQAFNATAGETVFSHNLDAFFSVQPQFSALRQPVEAFFAYSQRRFFDSGSAAPAVDLPALARQLRSAERRRA